MISRQSQIGTYPGREFEHPKGDGFACGGGGGLRQVVGGGGRGEFINWL